MWRTSRPRTAVLPFLGTPADSDLEYFGEGLAAEIFLALARIPGMFLIARSSVAALGAERDPATVGELLGAASVLHGTFSLRDDTVDLFVRLFDVSTAQDFWSEHYERPLDDVLTVLDEIVAGVVLARLNRPVLDPRLKIRYLHTANIAAFDYYLRGRRLYYEYSRQSVDAAAELFMHAIGIDPSYALAYCGLADCHSYRYMYVESTAEQAALAEEASDRALAIDGQLAEAHASRGFALALAKRFDVARDAFERAIELDPQLFEARFLYARASFAEGKLDRAARLFEEANLCRPEDYQSLFLAGQVYEDLGLPDRAGELRRNGVAVAEDHLALDPTETRALYLGANGLVCLGEVERGLEWLQRALDLEPDDPMLLYNAGCIYALVGKSERALDCLERTVDAGLRQRGWFEHDSNLDSLRAHPRFRALLVRLV